MKIATLCLLKEETLAEKVQGLPVLYDKRVQTVQNAWEKVAKSLDFKENCNFIRASSN